MSRTELVITAITTEGLTQPGPAPRYGLSPAVVELIVELRTRLAAAGHDAGPETIAWHLHHHHGHRVSRATISRCLTRAGRNGFEQQLRDWHVVQKNSRPGHPTTCGKVERFQQTLKNWLRRQPDQPATLPARQGLLDRFRTEYNQHRPHRSLPHRATPATLYDAMPKALPGPSRDTDTVSVTTGSAAPAPSPCAWPGPSVTSASAEPTQEPTSSC